MKHVYDATISIIGTRVSRGMLCNVPSREPITGRLFTLLMVTPLCGRFPDLQSPLGLSEAVLPSGRGIDGGQRSQKDTLTYSTPSSSHSILSINPQFCLHFCLHLLSACSSSLFPLGMLATEAYALLPPCVCVHVWKRECMCVNKCGGSVC